MIASATKACQRNTLQGIGQSAGFWCKAGLKVLVLIEAPVPKRNLEPETRNQEPEAIQTEFVDSN